jgi:hypothetical protein
MGLREIGLGGGGLDTTGSGQGPVAGCYECGDEPSGSCATELVKCSVASNDIICSNWHYKNVTKFAYLT